MIRVIKILNRIPPSKIFYSGLSPIIFKAILRKRLKMKRADDTHLQIVYRQRHMRLVRGFLRCGGGLVFVATLNHQAILSGPVIQRSWMSLGVAFQRD